jgi:cell division protein FtsB
MTERRTPSGQGPTRRRTGAGGRPAPSRTRNTGPIRVPSARRPPAGSSGGAAAKRTDAPRPRALTSRATVLIALVVVLALAYTYPLRVYLEQESQIAQMEAAVAAAKDEIADSEKQLAKWKDPEYLRIQALERFSYVRPGETPLLVVPNEGDEAAAAQQTPAAAPDRWYDTLWSSVQAANAEPSDVKPQD